MARLFRGLLDGSTKCVTFERIELNANEAMALPRIERSFALRIGQHITPHQNELAGRPRGLHQPINLDQASMPILCSAGDREGVDAIDHDQVRRRPI